MGSTLCAKFVKMGQYVLPKEPTTWTWTGSGSMWICAPMLTSKFSSFATVRSFSSRLLSKGCISACCPLNNLLYGCASKLSPSNVASNRLGWHSKGGLESLGQRLNQQHMEA